MLIFTLLPLTCFIPEEVKARVWFHLSNTGTWQAPCGLPEILVGRTGKATTPYKGNSGLFNKSNVMITNKEMAQWVEWVESVYLLQAIIH